MKTCYFCPKVGCKLCIFHIVEDGVEHCYWGYLERLHNEKTD